MKLRIIKIAGSRIVLSKNEALKLILKKSEGEKVVYTIQEVS